MLVLLVILLILYAILLPSRSVSIGLILIFFPVQIFLKKLKTRFLGHNTNQILNLLANSLNIISLSINSILDLVFCSFNKSNTASESYALMFNDFSFLINIYSFLAYRSLHLFSLLFAFEFWLSFFSFIWSPQKVYNFFL